MINLREEMKMKPSKIKLTASGKLELKVDVRAIIKKVLADLIADRLEEVREDFSKDYNWQEGKLDALIDELRGQNG